MGSDSPGVRQRLARLSCALFAGAALPALVLALPSGGADHARLTTTSSWRLAGSESVPGLPYKTQRAPFRYSFSCSGGTDPIYTWRLEAYSPATRKPIDGDGRYVKWQSVGQREASGEEVLKLEPGFAGYLVFQSRCAVDPGNELRHAASAPDVRTQTIILAPHILKPTVVVALNPQGVHSPSRLPRRARLALQLAVTTSREAGEGLRIRVVGAGVNHTQRVTFGANAEVRPKNGFELRFATKGPGKLRLWVESTPYNRRSNVVPMTVA